MVYTSCLFNQIRYATSKVIMRTVPATLVEIATSDLAAGPMAICCPSHFSGRQRRCEPVALRRCPSPCNLCETGTVCTECAEASYLTPTGWTVLPAARIGYKYKLFCCWITMFHLTFGIVFKARTVKWFKNSWHLLYDIIWPYDVRDTDTTFRFWFIYPMTMCWKGRSTSWSVQLIWMLSFSTLLLFL